MQTGKLQFGLVVGVRCPRTLQHRLARHRRTGDARLRLGTEAEDEIVRVVHTTLRARNVAFGWRFSLVNQPTAAITPIVSGGQCECWLGRVIEAPFETRLEPLWCGPACQVVWELGGETRPATRFGRAFS